MGRTPARTLHELAASLQAAQKRGVFVEVAVDPRELRPRIQEAEVTAVGPRMQRRFWQECRESDGQERPRVGGRRDAAHVAPPSQCMLPEQLLSEFAAQGGMSAPALRLAREILADSVAARGTSNHDPVDLDLYSVEMEGFGPFLQPTRYSFRLGGLRMVSGDNRDDLQAERCQRQPHMLPAAGARSHLRSGLNLFLPVSCLQQRCGEEHAGPGGPVGLHGFHRRPGHAHTGPAARRAPRHQGQSRRLFCEGHWWPERWCMDPAPTWWPWPAGGRGTGPRRGKRCIRGRGGTPSRRTARE